MPILDKVRWYELVSGKSERLWGIEAWWLLLQTKHFKYFKLECCKANRRKVGMGCTSLPAFLSLQSYCSPSSKGKNSVYLTFLAQAFCLFSHLCLSQQLSPHVSKSKDPPWTITTPKETWGRCQHFWSYPSSAKAHTCQGQQSHSSKI